MIVSLRACLRQAPPVPPVVETRHALSLLRRLFRSTGRAFPIVQIQRSRGDRLLALDFGLKVNSLARRAGDRLLLPLNIFQPVDRMVDMDLLNNRAGVRRAFTVLDSTEIVLPEGYRHAVLPEPKRATTGYGTIEISVTGTKDGGFIVNRKLVVNKGSYSGEEFAKFNDFVKTVKRFDQTKVVVMSKT